ERHPPGAPGERDDLVLLPADRCWEGRGLPPWWMPCPQQVYGEAKTSSGLVVSGVVVVTIGVGAIQTCTSAWLPRTKQRSPCHVHRHRTRPFQVQARLERCRGLRVQAQEGPERGHRPRDVVDEG